MTGIRYSTGYVGVLARVSTSRGVSIADIIGTQVSIITLSRVDSVGALVGGVETLEGINCARVTIIATDWTGIARSSSGIANCRIAHVSTLEKDNRTSSSGRVAAVVGANISVITNNRNGITASSGSIANLRSAQVRGGTLFEGMNTRKICTLNSTTIDSAWVTIITVHSLGHTT